MKKLSAFLFFLFVSAAFTWKNFSNSNKASKLKLQPGFKAEHIFSPSEANMGSWVSMCFDDKNRLITSDQYGILYRLEIPKIGEKNLEPNVKRLKIKNDSLQFGAAQGLLYAFNSLYVVVNNHVNKELPYPSGLYRLLDTDNDDEFDKLIKIKEFKGDGEHGPHSIRLSPDKKSIFLIAGNHTDLPELDNYKLPNTWKYDNLFPEIKDPRGHANNRKEPGGWLVSLNPDGSNWTLISAGFRNPFDFDFNEAGDVFVYDADMEWDFGMPWYRPTRICLASSGSEFGWRTGDGKWEASFFDSQEPIINIGQGSPTNLVYLKDAKFPQKYKHTLLAFDWSFGIIHSLHLKPNGSSYSAQREEFLSGVPLPLTDGVIGPDGALYFLTGGRRLDSDLYRVYYEGSDSVENISLTQITPENLLRKKLEALHLPNAGQLEFIWENLSHKDKGVRYAARIALEHQNIELWKNKIEKENNVDTKIQAYMALIRSDSTLQSKDLFASLCQLNVTYLKEKYDYSRLLEVAIFRFGKPDGKNREKLINSINPLFPSNNQMLDRQLSKLLVTLEAPGIIEKMLNLMDNKATNDDSNSAISSDELIMRNPQYGLDIANLLDKTPPKQSIFYGIMLANKKEGWTKQTREKYFEWFSSAYKYKGGNSYVGFINEARKIALNNVPAELKDGLEKLSEPVIEDNQLNSDEFPIGPWHNWKLNEAIEVVDKGLKNRNFERGRAMYIATTCSRCHSIKGEGGNIGPDLSQIGTRFDNKDLLEAIIDPSKEISDQYAATQYQLKDGTSVVGKLVNEDKDFVYISLNPYAPQYIERINKNEILSSDYSSVSLMLPGLINSLNEEELKDLVAYLKSGGNKNSEYFK